MLKKLMLFSAAFTVLCGQLVVGVAAQGLTVSAKSAILINAVTNEVIYEKNAHQQMGMASTTKIMTSILAIEYGKLNKNVTVRADDVRVEGTSIGLKAGDTISLEALVYGMLLESGNDAANVTATAVGGSMAAFVELMNKKARELGMNNTCFKNPSGLTQAGHYSTAYDMALLGSYAVKNTQFSSICSQKTVNVTYGNPQCQRTFSNHNKLLGTYDGAFGIKTGFTKASGRCLVSAAERDGVTLVAVTLSAPNDWADHKALFDYGFERVKEYKADFNAEKISIDVVGSNKKAINVRLSAPLTYTALKEQAGTSVVVFCENFLYAGIKKGDVVGKAVLYSQNGTRLCESQLLSQTDAPIAKARVKNKSFFEKIKDFFSINNR